MTEIVQIGGASYAVLNSYVGPARELRVDTDTWDLIIEDGSTPGGHRLLNEANADARYQQFNSELAGIGPYQDSAHGFLVRLGPADYAIRNIGVTGDFTISNPDGFTGDPVLGLAQILGGNRTLDGAVHVTGQLTVDGGINAAITGSVVGGVFNGGSVTSSSWGDFTTDSTAQYALRVRGQSAGGNAILEFTSNDGTSTWAEIQAANHSLTVTGATLGCPSGFVGNLQGNVTGNLTGTASSATNANYATTSGACTGNAATSSSCSGNAASATTAASCSGNSATATRLQTLRTIGAIGGPVIGSATFDGSGNATWNTSIADKAIRWPMIADVAGNTILGNNGVAGPAQSLSPAQLWTMLGGSFSYDSANNHGTLIIPNPGGSPVRIHFGSITVGGNTLGTANYFQGNSSGWSYPVFSTEVSSNPTNSSYLHSYDGNGFTVQNNTTNTLVYPYIAIGQ